MQNTWIWVVVAVVVIGGGFWWWQSTQMPVVATPVANTSTPVDTGAATQVPVDTGTPTPTPSVPMTATVTYDGTSFSPASVTVKKGGTVAWNNEGTNPMWIASNSHPNHTAYSGTSRTAHCPDTSKTAFDQCASGNNYTFKFDKVGTWNYHDHMNPTSFGSVTVVQ